MTPKSKPSKIAVIYHWLPHYRESVFNEMAREYDAIFLADDKTQYEDLKLAETKNLSVIRLQNVWIGPFLWQRGLLNFLRRQEIDRIIFLADWKFISTWAALLLFRRHVTIGWTHGLSKHENSLQKRLKLLFYKRFSHIWTYSEDAANRLRALNFDALAVYNSNGVAARLNPSQEGNKDLLFVGRVLKERKLAEAISFLFIQNTFPHRLHIVGNGPDIPQLKRLVADHAVQSNVVFHGAIYNETEIAAIAKSCSVFLHPTDIGLSALTALKLGLKVFTHSNNQLHKPEFEALQQCNGVFEFYFGPEMDYDDFLHAFVSMTPLNETLVDNILQKWSPMHQLDQMRKHLGQP